MSYLHLDGLSKRFGDFVAVDRVTLDLERGQILALLGPSGSGKTTTLRLLAGFETPDAGRIVVDGEDVTRTAPVGRRFGMVFQHYALFPHLDVGENWASGLESRGVRGTGLTRRVSEQRRKLSRRMCSWCAAGVVPRSACCYAILARQRIDAKLDNGRRCCAVGRCRLGKARPSSSSLARRSS